MVKNKIEKNVKEQKYKKLHFLSPRSPSQPSDELDSKNY